MRATALTLVLLCAGCASRRPPAYSDRCDDPARPCALTYDFEPSGAARDVFAPPGAQPQFLVVNEDGALFRWMLSPSSPFDHDNVKLVRPLEHVTKLESATSAVCGGTPVFLAGANFMPGRKGRQPKRERIVAIAGEIDAKVRVLEKLSAAVYEAGQQEAARRLGPEAKGGERFARIEGLALAPGCDRLFVGVRGVSNGAGAEVAPAVYPIVLDVDWSGEREEATLGAPLDLDLSATCSGQPEGISDLAALPDGGLLVLTSYEKEFKAREKPEEVPEGELGGSLWRRRADGRTDRLACFPGHKPEGLAVDAASGIVRVILEDDEYGGRPIGAFAIRLELKP